MSMNIKYQPQFTKWFPQVTDKFTVRFGMARHCHWASLLPLLTQEGIPAAEKKKSSHRSSTQETIQKTREQKDPAYKGQK